MQRCKEECLGLLAAIAKQLITVSYKYLQIPPAIKGLRRQIRESAPFRPGVHSTIPILDAFRRRPHTQNEAIAVNPRRFRRSSPGNPPDFMCVQLSEAC